MRARPITRTTTLLLSTRHFRLSEDGEARVIEIAANELPLESKLELAVELDAVRAHVRKARAAKGLVLDLRSSPFADELPPLGFTELTRLADPRFERVALVLASFSDMRSARRILGPTPRWHLGLNRDEAATFAAGDVLESGDRVRPGVRLAAITPRRSDPAGTEYWRGLEDAAPSESPAYAAIRVAATAERDLEVWARERERGTSVANLRAAKAARSLKLKLSTRAMNLAELVDKDGVPSTLIGALAAEVTRLEGEAFRLMFGLERAPSTPDDGRASQVPTLRPGWRRSS